MNQPATAADLTPGERDDLNRALVRRDVCGPEGAVIEASVVADIIARRAPVRPSPFAS